MPILLNETVAGRYDVRINAKTAPYLDFLYARDKRADETIEQFCARLLRRTIKEQYLATAHGEAIAKIQEDARLAIEAVEQEINGVPE